MSKNMIITLGNCGTQCGKVIANTPSLDDVILYSIDSQVNNIDMSLVNRINVIPIVSDDKNGSGRNRERGEAMFKFHEKNGAFEKMYQEAVNAKSPVLVITSGAGGTGSGTCTPLCKTLIDKGVEVVPVIVLPAMEDPAAFHLNANDLLAELDAIGVETYTTFRNLPNTADYTAINNDVANLVEIIFGKKYDKTDKDSIDESDLDVILGMPGRFIAVSAEGNNVDVLRKELTRKVLNGFQPAWTQEDADAYTFMIAASLKSSYADTDFTDVFSDINKRIVNKYDELKNIVCDDNNGKMSATIIVAGLPRGEIKIIESAFKETKGIGEGINKSVRPSFTTRKKASVITADGSKDGPAVNQFKWKK